MEKNALFVVFMLHSFICHFKTHFLYVNYKLYYLLYDLCIVMQVDEKIKRNWFVG